MFKIIKIEKVQFNAFKHWYYGVMKFIVFLYQFYLLYKPKMVQMSKALWYCILCPSGLGIDASKESDVKFIYNIAVSNTVSSSRV